MPDYALDPDPTIPPGAFGKEAEFETTIADMKAAIFGASRIYLDVKKLNGERDRTQNLLDWDLLYLSSPRRPVLYLVEVELARRGAVRCGTSSSGS